MQRKRKKSCLALFVLMGLLLGSAGLESHAEDVDASHSVYTQTRLKNAKKMANAIRQTDYEEGASEAFRESLSEVEEELERARTADQYEALDEQIARAVTKLEESALLPVRETKKLIDRITGPGSSERFLVEVIPADEATGNDVYEIAWDASAKKPILRGNDGVSLATAFNYYLKYYAYLDFPYVGECDLALPRELPQVPDPVRIVFPYAYRHYFNENCEYKYTVDLYGEEQWQRRIDWMAMNGFNMFLLDLGEHAIWYNAREELGLNEAAIGELQRYSNGTEQYYGQYTLSLDSILQEGALAKKVAEMAFRAGIEPEVRPFIGQVPFLFPAQHNDYYGSSSKAKMTISLEGSIFDGMLLYSAARWMNLPQGVFISPETASADRAKADEMKEKFIQISDIYYASLQETLGYDEWGRTPAYVYKDLVAEQGFVVRHEAFPQKVIGEMNEQLMKLNPDAIWLQTSWRYQSWLPQYYENGQLMFVDLCAENNPKWNTSNEFGGTPWLWSMLFNYGGNTGMEGDLKGLAESVLTAGRAAHQMKGISISPEGGDTNPALYAMMAEMTWRSEAPDMDQWVQDYIKRRYGAENYEHAKIQLDHTWDVLCGSVYQGFTSFQGPAQTLVNAYPKLTGSLARYYGSNEKLYRTSELIPAWRSMLEAAECMDSVTPQFLYDLTDLTRQVLADMSGEIYAKIKPAFDAGDKKTAMYYADRMVQLCHDLDEILATNESFLLGDRLAHAKNRGVTPSDQDFYEQVERTFLTYWVLDYPDAYDLTDYCNRHLSGLMTDYYGMRWKIFAQYLEQALDRQLNASQFESQIAPLILQQIKEQEVKWSKEHTPYPTEAKGSTTEVSARLYREYQELMEILYRAEDDSRDMDRTQMTAAAGNEQAAAGTEGPASNVLDQNAETIWHTAWNGSARDVQWIDLTLDGEHLADGLRYLPRTDGGNGNVTGYEIYVSDDGGASYRKVSEGRWDADSTWKLAVFAPVKATNVRLQVTDAVSLQEGILYASAAELRVTTADGEYSRLGDALTAAREKKETDYTKESWQVFADALREADEIFQSQTEDWKTVLAAIEKLTQASARLKKKETPPPPEDDTGKEDVPPIPVKPEEPIAVGKIYPVGTYFYKVTSLSKKTVEVTGMKKKKAERITISNEVTLGNKVYKVTSIGASAFQTCSRAKSAVIGKYVRKIGSKAFYNCKKLKTIRVKSKCITSIGKNALKGIQKKAIIKVPSVKYKKYKKLFIKKGLGKAAKIKKY